MDERVENYAAEVNIIKFKERIYDRVYESLSRLQYTELLKAIRGIEQVVKVEASPETATSTDESEERAADGLQAEVGEDTITTDLNRKLPKPKRKMMARRLFKFIGYQFPKMPPIHIEFWCKTILTVLCVDVSDFRHYGVDEERFQNI